MSQYLPYGGDKNPNDLLQNSSYKFTDQEQDEGTGLYNYDARLYDPVLGQFIMADTIVPNPFNPQSFNRYTYCLNNPIKYTDHRGHLYENNITNHYFGQGFMAMFNTITNPTLTPEMEQTAKVVGVVAGVALAIATPADEIGALSIALKGTFSSHAIFAAAKAARNALYNAISKINADTN
ncbi:MAG: RHS repeat-associated core domain-containing protein [Desulfobacteraceae bacterium]|nr:RHS repeat-associated core domain-containing protein [Desulfobacteraceae bacterium]